MLRALKRKLFQSKFKSVWIYFEKEALQIFRQICNAIEQGGRLNDMLWGDTTNAHQGGETLVIEERE